MIISFKRACAPIALGLVIGSVTLLSPNDGHAHGGATGVVKERMDVMTMIGDAMKKITAMFKRQVPYDDQEVARLAAVIAEQGGEDLTKLFPEGSLHGPSEALPAVWERWDRFQTVAAQLSEKARVLESNAPQMMPGAMMSFMDLAKTCNACHTEFRKKDEH